jgi:hypothetical protein
LGLTALIILSQPPQAVQAADAVAPVAAYDSQAIFHDKVIPLLEQNCFECHGNGEHKGDIALDSFKTVADVEKQRGQWQEVLKDIKAGVMPMPYAKHKPSQKERNIITDWVERELYQYDPAHPYPGRVTIHRLNRAEYNNTIRDLLALDITPADAFPGDDSGYGFDNNGDVLTIAPMLMEKYVNAAGVVLDKAIFCDPIVPAPVKHWVAANEMDGSIPKSDPNAVTGGRGAFGRSMPNGRVFGYSGDIYADYDFPADGTYTIHLRAYGDARPMVQVKIDDKNVGPAIAITSQMANTEVYGTQKIKVTAGKHRISLALTNGATKAEYDIAMAKAATRPAAPAVTLNLDNANDDAVAADAAAKPQPQQQPEQQPQPRPQPQSTTPNPTGVDPSAVAVATLPPSRVTTDSTGVSPAGGPATLPTTNPAARGRGGRGARGGARGARGARGGARGGPGGTLTGKATLGVVFVEAEGPVDITPDRMPESYRRVFVAYPSATVTKAQAAEKIIRNFASKAFRRPVSDDEVNQLMALWTKQDAGGDTFETSIATTLQAVLVSPYFLYRYEQDPSDQDADGIRTLDEYELASRLSYFLWSSMPDDELMQLAAKGQLRANLESQVRRMMKDPKSFALVENFAGQWLQLRQMNTVNPDPKRFPTFDDTLRQAMVKETQLYFSAIMTEDRSIMDFIDSDYTFMNETLAKHYGRTDVTGDDFRKVKLTGDQRGGLLTQASILTLTSYPNRTSPVLRGKWVLENLLDAAPPPPPPDVPKLVETAQAEISGTLRQRMEQHRADPKCITCHAAMDPIGFGLENYDAIGRWRDKDINNVPIDASGTLPDGSNFNGAVGLKEILKDRSDEFCRCLTDRLMTYALGRGTEVYDRPMEDQISASLKQKDYKFSALVMQIVESDAFQKRGVKRGEQ